MEKMPFPADRQTSSQGVTTPDVPGASEIVTSDWRQQLPVLMGESITLRELEVSDAPSLLAMLTSDEVSRFISPPPTTVAGFERFITWAQSQRRAGQYVCFAVVPNGVKAAVGLFQVRQMEAGFRSEERRGG